MVAKLLFLISISSINEAKEEGNRRKIHSLDVEKTAKEMANSFEQQSTMKMTMKALADV